MIRLAHAGSGNSRHASRSSTSGHPSGHPAGGHTAGACAVSGHIVSGHTVGGSTSISRTARSHPTVLTAIVIATLTCILPLGACRRGAAPPAAAAPPAKIAGGVAEGTLTTVTLSGAARARLGVETAPVERKAIARSRTLGGEIVPSGGAQTTVTAPLAGTLGTSTRAPGVGARVAAGEVLFTIVPLGPAERDVRIEAERAVTEATGRQEMAAKRAARATQLAADGSGSRRAAEEAQADLAAADAALKAARDRFSLVTRRIGEGGAIALESPAPAILRALHARPGQTVGAGAPLADLVSLDTVWLRVPVFAGDLDTLDRRAAASVSLLGAAAQTPSIQAAPVTAPPAADAATAGVDLFYAVRNANHTFAPGQRVTVRIPLRAESDSLVVPRAAVLFDALGGTWVYEARDAGTFVRRRVALTDFVGEAAVLRQGPAPGTRVVTTGAAELFGTEFGVGK